MSINTSFNSSISTPLQVHMCKSLNLFLKTPSIVSANVFVYSEALVEYLLQSSTYQFAREKLEGPGTYIHEKTWGLIDMKTGLLLGVYYAEPMARIAQLSLSYLQFIYRHPRETLGHVPRLLQVTWQAALSFFFEPRPNLETSPSKMGFIAKNVMANSGLNVLLQEIYEYGCMNHEEYVENLSFEDLLYSHQTWSDPFPLFNHRYQSLRESFQILKEKDQRLKEAFEAGVLAKEQLFNIQKKDALERFMPKANLIEFNKKLGQYLISAQEAGCSSEKYTEDEISEKFPKCAEIRRVYPYMLTLFEHKPLILRHYFQNLEGKACKPLNPFDPEFIALNAELNRRIDDYLPEL